MAAKSTWSPATPSDVTSVDGGTTITNPEETPTLPCGCADLVLEGEVVMQDDNGLELRCTDPDIISGGQTIFTQDNECALYCDRVLAWDLYCSQGVWSVTWLTQAADVWCYVTTQTTPDRVTLSTFWAPEPTAGHKK